VRRPRSEKRCRDSQLIVDTILEKYNSTPKYSESYVDNYITNLYLPVSVKRHYLDEKYILGSYFQHHVFYCNHHKKLYSSPFLSWVQIGYDKSGWLLVCFSNLLITIYSYLYILKVKQVQRSSHGFSWLTCISLSFRQDHTPVSKKIILLFAFTGWFLSVLYECFVQSETTAPFHPHPYENLNQMIEDGYKLFYDQVEDLKGDIDYEIFIKYNLTSKASDLVQKSDFKGQMFDRGSTQKIYRSRIESEYNAAPFKRLHCHILPDPFYAEEYYYTFTRRFQTQLQQSFAVIFSSGISLHFESAERFETYSESILIAEKQEYKDRLPLRMSVGERIYTIFVILLALLIVSFIVFLLQICICNRHSVIFLAKNMYFLGLSIFSYSYQILRRKWRQLITVIRIRGFAETEPPPNQVTVMCRNN